MITTALLAALLCACTPCEDRQVYELIMQVDADADIVIFDPAIIEDRPTFQKPNQTSVGMTSG